VPGKRTDSWLKIKSQKRQEAIIVGYTEPKGARKFFGALILAVWDKKQLIYVGHTGGGFDEAGLKSLKNKMDKLIIKKCPLAACPKTNAPAHWIRPKLVAEIKFHEWTSDGLMRQPIFLGLREDKNQEEVQRE
jgi:bifunctional non-homologous end joining protein LigD